MGGLRHTALSGLQHTALSGLQHTALSGLRHTALLVCFFLESLLPSEGRRQATRQEMRKVSGSQQEGLLILASMGAKQLSPGSETAQGVPGRCCDP